MGFNAERYKNDPKYHEMWNARCKAWREKKRGLRATKRARQTPREKHLINRYGITLGQFQAMLLGQGGKCAICSSNITGDKEAHVDHCHTTGRIRGLLCFSCNNGLGAFKDDVIRLEAACLYLTNHSVVDRIDLKLTLNPQGGGAGK